MAKSPAVRALFAHDFAACLWLCAGLVVFGIYLRVHDLGMPPQFSWDEFHFVENARNYLNGAADWNDHPPLGKLLMALTLRWFGDSAAVWRLVALITGILNIALGARLAQRAFNSLQVSAVAAALLAIDGFLICYSRTALLDGILTFFTLLALYWTLTARSAWGLFKAALAVGGAMSVKLSGAALVLPLLLRLLTLGLSMRTLLALVGVPLAYVSQFSLGLALTHKPYGLSAVLRATRDLLSHHLALTDMKHPNTSHWYTWWIPRKPIVLRFEADEFGFIHAMSSLANPLLWWASWALIIALFLHSVRWLYFAAKAWPVSAADDTLTGFTPRIWRALKAAEVPALGQDKALEPVWRDSRMLVLGWLVMLLPWVLTKRDSYIYHYLPSYALSLIVLAGALHQLWQTRRKLGLIVLFALAEVSVFYAPVWSQFPLTEAGYHARLFAPGWR